MGYHVVINIKQDDVDIQRLAKSIESVVEKVTGEKCSIILQDQRSLRKMRDKLIQDQTQRFLTKK